MFYANVLCFVSETHLGITCTILNAIFDVLIINDPFHIHITSQYPFLVQKHNKNENINLEYDSSMCFLSTFSIHKRECKYAAMICYLRDEAYRGVVLSAI